jgi:hypothetical protein
VSTSTILGAVGGTIGWFVGGPAGAQWGFMIGSAVGAIVDPQKFEGPRLGEARTQTAQDGVPLIYGYGTFPCAGNLAWVDAVKEVRKKESAKGGPTNITYTYTVSYMIVVCKGEISGYKIIKRNGKIVYDARTDAELTALGYSASEISETRAAQSSFLQRATLYYGTQTQMPDPTMVAVKGEGEVPAYTGIAYIVLKDDETREGEVSQYEFVVANCGERTTDNNLISYLLVTGSNSGPGNPLFATAEAVENPVFSTIPQSANANILNALPSYYGGIWVVVGIGGARYSIDNMATWQTGSTPFASDAQPYTLVAGPSGWLVSNSESPLDEIAKSTSLPFYFQDYEYSATRAGDGPWNVGAMGMCRYTAGYYYGVYGGTTPGQLFRSPNLGEEWEGLYKRGDDGPANGDTITAFHDICAFGGALYAMVQWRPLSGQRAQVKRSLDGGLTWPDLIIDTALDDLDAPWQLEASENTLLVLSWGARYVWTSEDGFSAPHETGLATMKAASRLAETRGRQLVFSAPRFYLISGNAPGGESAKGNKLVSTEDGITFSTPLSIPLNNPYGIAVSDTSTNSNLAEIPDAPGYYIDSFTGLIVGPPGTSIDPCSPTLGEIVANQCQRRGVTDRDVSELTDDVDGYRIAAPSTPQRNIQGLQPGYFFGASEFDGTLHFPKRGRALTFALTHDDFVERDGDPIQWERTEESQLLRKHTVGYIDPMTSYTATTQMAERRSATISAEGESTAELAITGSKDWAAQVADKSIKVAWGEPDECTFHVTIDHAELVTGAEGTVPYLDGTITPIRIDRIEDEGMVRMVTGRRTRANLYESNASGAAKPLPRFPGSNMRGPTDGFLMNIPVLVDSNDFPGIHWAASGILSGWLGTQLQFLIGGEWVVVGETDQSAITGSLLAPLSYHAGDFDTENVLQVKMNDPLESVTYVNLLNERNPMAILRPDGTAEIIQFQTATEVSSGIYDLTNLLRNRLDSGSSDHATGARVVFLDASVQYASLAPTEIGQTLTYRFVSLGTDPDAAPVQTMELTTMESQREWPVTNLHGSRDGDDFTLSWLPRHRLGSDTFPIRSENWVSYRVEWSHSGGSGQEDMTDETVTINLPGASDVTFSVSQVNQFTGEGPATTVEIP